MVEHLLTQGRSEIMGNRTIIPTTLGFCLDLFLAPYINPKDKATVQLITAKLM